MGDKVWTLEQKWFFLSWVKMSLRSNFNSRGVNSRELFWFWGHSSESPGAFLTKIGRNLPTSLPDLSKPKKSRSNRRKTKILDPEIFGTPTKNSRLFAVERMGYKNPRPPQDRQERHPQHFPGDWEQQSIETSTTIETGKQDDLHLCAFYKKQTGLLEQLGDCNPPLARSAGRRCGTFFLSNNRWRSFCSLEVFFWISKSLQGLLHTLPFVSPQEASAIRRALPKSAQGASQNRSKFRSFRGIKFGSI